jgi:hypothetical protein
MKAILKEPLLHFLLLGAGLFVAYGLVSKAGNSAAPEKIVVTAGQIEHLSATYARESGHPPTEVELNGLIDGWAREELAVREAMALGLNKDDTVIRRRLQRKLEFLSDDLAANIEPNDADLNAYLLARPDAFHIEPRFSFSQVFLDPAKHGDHLASDTAQMLVRLRQSGAEADTAALGDPLALNHQYQSTSASEVAQLFGEPFAAALDGLTPGQWQGPVTSTLGVHLVRVRQRTAGHQPALADVRDAVRQEWMKDRRLEEREKYYAALMKRYTVIIDGREPQK